MVFLPLQMPSQLHLKLQYIREAKLVDPPYGLNCLFETEGPLSRLFNRLYPFQPRPSYPETVAAWAFTCFQLTGHNDAMVWIKYLEPSQYGRVEIISLLTPGRIWLDRRDIESAVLVFAQDENYNGELRSDGLSDEPDYSVGIGRPMISSPMELHTITCTLPRR